ncbi:MAG: DUF1501 domain-containing protein [Actinomycetota bacterium]|nr:DUF1501 domain-containing protein [Actinomycetota bacterium]
MNAHKACADFHRTSDATRRRYLAEGGGLTRRQVLRRGIGAGLAVYAAQAMPLTRVFEAAEASAQAAPNAPILVSVFLPGGCDLLDTLVPLGQYGAYAGKRRAIRQSEGAAKLGSTGLGAHPALTRGAGGGIAGMFARGQIGFLPGIDYANPDLSHFHSRHFWETGLITQSAGTGWLGRWLDTSGGRDNPLQALSMSGALAPVLRANQAPVAALDSANGAQVWMPGVWGKAYDRAWSAYAELAAQPAPGAAGAAAATSARLMHDVAARLEPFAHDDDEPDPLGGSVQYPKDSKLADRLRTLAGLLSAPLGVRVAAVEADGQFDTHDDQKEDLDRCLGDVSEALSAFQADLAARGLADRVLTFVWSEFGRRAEQNASGGTDHGAGGIAWVQGPRARAGVLTDYPDLKRLDKDGNLAVTVDFRRVYASLLEQWMGTDAGAVIPNAGAFGRVGLVA